MNIVTIRLAGIIACVYLMFPNIAVGRTCNSPGTAVYYVNGVWVTTERDAKISLKYLASNFDAFRQNTSLQAECVEYNLAYNQSELFIGDLLETGIQMLGGAMTDFWRFWAGLDILPDWFQQEAISIALSIDNASYVIDADLREHLRKYRQSLSAGHRVAVLAHSQGNLYANSEFNIIYGGLDGQVPLATPSFGVTAIATVAGSVAGNGTYTTSTGDLIVDALITAAVQLQLPTPLFPNTFGLPSFTDPTGHLFVPSYLTGSFTGPKILQNLMNLVLDLDRPPLPIEIINNLGVATSSTKLNFPAGGLTISGDQYPGPEFTITERTIITEIGAFVNTFRTHPLDPPSPPFLVQIRPANVNGFPDASVVLGQFEMSHDNDPLVISYESVNPNIVLDPGTYFALFLPQADDIGGLITQANDTAYQGEVPHKNRHIKSFYRISYWLS